MKYTHIYPVLFALLLFGCTKDRETSTGLKVKVHKEGTGAYGKPGEFLITRMIIKGPQDSLFRDTDEQDIPMIIAVSQESGVGANEGINSAFQIMKLGDSVSIDIEAKTLLGNRPLPPQLKPEDHLTYIFVVRDIADQAGVDRIQREMQDRQRLAQMRTQAEQLTTDTLAIDAYLAAKRIKATHDKSGIRYVIKRLGNGDVPSVNSTIRVTYKGSLMDGRIFDQSSVPVEWPLSQMIDGWKVGFTFLPSGTSATLYIPSTLGYGQNGYPPDIPPNANLIFEVELLDVKN